MELFKSLIVFAICITLSSCVDFNLSDQQACAALKMAGRYIVRHQSFQKTNALIQETIDNSPCTDKQTPKTILRNDYKFLEELVQQYNSLYKPVTTMGLSNKSSDNRSYAAHCTVNQAAVIMVATTIKALMEDKEKLLSSFTGVLKAICKKSNKFYKAEAALQFLLDWQVKWPLELLGVVYELDAKVTKETLEYTEKNDFNMIVMLKLSKDLDNDNTFSRTYGLKISKIGSQVVLQKVSGQFIRSKNQNVDDTNEDLERIDTLNAISKSIAEDMDHVQLALISKIMQKYDYNFELGTALHDLVENNIQMSNFEITLNDQLEEEADKLTGSKFKTFAFKMVKDSSEFSNLSVTSYVHVTTPLKTAK